MKKSVHEAIRETRIEGMTWDEGEDALDRLEAMKLDDPAEYAARARCLASANRYPAALDDFNAAISGGCEDPQVYFGLGGTLSALGRREEAVGALQRAVRLLPDSGEAVYALCWELERLGRYEEVLGELRRYAKHDTLHNYSIYQHWGRIRGKQKKWKSAYASYVKCVRLNPPDREHQDSVVQKYRQITDIRLRAAKADPEDVRSFVKLGQELSAAGWDDTAIDVLGTAALMRPDAGLYRHIGEMHEASLNLTEAIDTYKEGIRRLSGTVKPADLAPLYEGAVVNLSKCGRNQEAVRYGREAISLGIDGPKLCTYYSGAKDDATPHLDPVRAGWTSPPYGSVLVMPDGDYP